MVNPGTNRSRGLSRKEESLGYNTDSLSSIKDGIPSRFPCIPHRIRVFYFQALLHFFALGLGLDLGLGYA